MGVEGKKKDCHARLAPTCTRHVFYILVTLVLGTIMTGIPDSPP